MHLKNWQCNYLFFSYTIVISLSLELYSHPFWLVCTNDLVKDRCIADNITIHCILLFIILKRRFHVPAYLFWDIDHKDMKMWFKNISYMLGSFLCATFFVLTAVFCCCLWSITEKMHGNMESFCWRENILLVHMSIEREVCVLTLATWVVTE